jgi:flagellar basal-body rod protein FlgG
MLEGLYSAAAGMAAQQEQLNAIGNDLANLNTSGYRSERVAFRDLLYNPVEMAGTTTAVGAGAGAAVIGSGQAQGEIKQTGDPLNVAIEGEGFLGVTLANGTVALTRDGALTLDANGSITTAEGDRLSPPITVPAGIPASALRIAGDGTVTAAGKTLGQIKLMTVAAPERLLANGSGQLTSSAASGAPTATATGTIHQGALEESNVDMAREMALMVSTQRAFQMTSSAIQNDSQMMTYANELRPA